MEQQQIDYLALGDSYTIGESVSEQERYPVLLSHRFQYKDVRLGDPRIIAKTGWTTDELLAALDSTTIEAPYELVSLLIGVNNQYRGRDIDNYRSEFRECLGRAISYAGDDPKRVFVLSIPDWGVTPFAEERDREQIAHEIEAYNQVNEEESKKSGVYYISITDISREAADDVTLLAEDGLHPSGEMYARWVDRIFPVVENILLNQ